MSQDDATRSKTFTYRELRKLNDAHNVHVAYHGKVYDVSSFLGKHPGGREQILLCSGMDISAIFESYHPNKAIKVLEKYCVGKLDSTDCDLPHFPRRGEFSKELTKRVNTYFKANNIDRKNDVKSIFIYTIFLSAALLFWITSIAVHDYWTLGAVSGGLWGFFTSTIALTLAHDASHFSITHKPWVWTLLQLLAGPLVGLSGHVWKFNHTFGHHSFTNIERVDPDFFVDNKGRDIRRITAAQRWFPHYVYQHIYLPVLYCFIHLLLRLKDFMVVATLKSGSLELNPLTAFQWLIFFYEKLMFAAYRVIVPWYFMSWSSVLYINAFHEVVYGLWLGFTSQVTHINNKVQSYRVSRNNSVKMDWAELQVQTAQDYATDSWCWNLFTGGLNHQVVHHLFPDVMGHHLGKIQPIIEETCAEFGITYNHHNSALSALASHLDFLYSLGKKY